jgi:hypothetical protein
LLRPVEQVRVDRERGGRRGVPELSGDHNWSYFKPVMSSEANECRKL